MNQHRWTCLTTVVLTTVIAPLATAHARTLPSPAMGSGNSYIPLSPQSLPIITPLVVTELETDAAIPVVVKSVPKVSKLPSIKIIATRKSQLLNRQPKTLIGGLPTENLHEQSPVAKLPSITSIFNPNSRVTNSIISIPNPIEPSVPRVTSVATISHQVTTPVLKPQAFTSQTASAPIVVVGDQSLSSSSKALPTTVITNSATAEAEIASILSATPGQFSEIGTKPATTVIGTTIDQPQTTFAPQVAPLVQITNKPRAEGLRQQAEIPSFEAGLPVFVFDNERTSQIVATAIAQVDGATVAPEPSIAIPVERPKQSNVPSLAQPAGTGIVKIEQPSATIRPTLDKIVATQTGQASWYGIEGGSQTANGERYNPDGLTAAHRTLPFGTKVRVTSIKTGKSTIVRINDRGPFRSRRIIDVSAGAAKIIGIKNDGVGDVRMDILDGQG